MEELPPKPRNDPRERRPLGMNLQAMPQLIADRPPPPFAAIRAQGPNTPLEESRIDAGQMSL